MHPWTDEEKARGRNTGFVCFMKREDAEEAMEAFAETDAFQNGRRLMLRWGKNVRKRNLVKKGTGVPAKFRSTRKKGITTSSIQPSSAAATSPSSSVISRDSYRKLSISQDDLKSGNSGLFNSNAAVSGFGGRNDRESSALAKATNHENLLSKRTYPEGFDESKAIRVIPPSDPKRVKLICAVAALVARDGSIVEDMLIDRVGITDRQTFGFLFPSSNTFSDTITSEEQNTTIVNERLFYKWRVYAYAQGDGDYLWRLEQFQMFASSLSEQQGGSSNGRWWIPPDIINHEAAQKELEEKQQRENEIAQQQARRYQVKQEVLAIKEKKKYMTGRQLEQARMEGVYTLDTGGGITSDGRSTVGERQSGSRRKHTSITLRAKRGEEELTKEELVAFKRLIQQRLTCSRKSICEAMAFCFDKSGSALEICQRLKDTALEEVHTSLDGVFPSSSSYANDNDDDTTTHNVPMRVSLETRMARLFLLSDVLFNSQQPGVRNAFRFRTAIEEILPELFESLSKLVTIYGRLTYQKLQRAVSSVTRAWLNWSVYDETFIKDLLNVFDGKITAQELRTKASKKSLEYDKEKNKRDDGHKEGTKEQEGDNKDEGKDEKDLHHFEEGVNVDDAPFADNEGAGKFESNLDGEDATTSVEKVTREDLDGEPIDDVDGEPIDDVDGELIIDDVDGEPIDDVDGEPIDDVDGEPIIDDVDGEPLEDVDGEPMGEDDNVDGGPIMEDDDFNGEPMEDTDLVVDGEPLDKDGETLERNVDVEPITTVEGENSADDKTKDM